MSKNPTVTDPSYKVDKAIYLDEIRVAFTQLTHRKTGAKILHLGNDDPENLFCLSLQTFPLSDNGAPHILEHTVLCGSKKFPVRDPFFSMTRRSLNTFMNAMTGDDLTFYPASSQVPKDFYNLLDVYLDAVFHPNLRRLSFLQEGHRFEFENPDDPSTPLELKGIVYNEMKGAMSQPDSRLYHEMMRALFPDTPYRYNSGGEPWAIPLLTYEELVEFHRAYYHPSRCLFYFYGNLPLSDHLDFLSKTTLDKSDPLPPLPPMTRQPRFTVPVALEGRYPLVPEEEESNEERGLMALSWLTCDIREQHEVLALNVIDLLLMGTDASPLKRALLRSGLCTQVDSYLDDSNCEVPWIVNFRGVKPENGQKIEELLIKTLGEICATPFAKRQVEAAIHQLEFDRCEIGGDSHPYGLSLFLRTGPLLQHGGEAEDGLRIHTLFAELRHRCEKSGYLEGMIRNHLIDNSHRVRLVLRPDPDLSQEETAFEEKFIEAAEEKLDDKRKKEIVSLAKELAESQNEDEGERIEALPKVTLDDVTPAARRLSLDRRERKSLETFHHSCFTNEILYLSLCFESAALSDEELPYARLFTSLLPEVGFGGRGYEETLELIQEHTGGISASFALQSQATNYHLFHPILSIGGRALVRKTDRFITLLKEMVTSADFTDRARLEELVRQVHSGLEHSLTRNALNYATQLAASRFAEVSRISNRMWGLDYFYAIRKIGRNFEREVDALIQKMGEMRDRLLLVQKPHLVVGCDQETMGQLERADFYGLDSLPAHAAPPFAGCKELPEVPSQGLVIASPVAFTCKMIPSISYSHPDAPALSIASRIFSDKILLKRVREQGGAYGAGASHHPMQGHFQFFGYRDPNLTSTLDAFDEAVGTVAEGRFTTKDLEEAKLRMIQKMDSPISPGSRAAVAYTWMREGKTDEMRQAYRDQLLALNAKEVSGAVQRHIVPQMGEKAITVCCASRELLERENLLIEKKRGERPLLIKAI
jgi:presequence protease